MESRVMGNCHARFGAGEKVNGGAIVPLEALPIAIVGNGCGGAGEQAAGPVSKEPVRGAQPPDGAVGGGVFAALSLRQYPGGDQKGL